MANTIEKVESIRHLDLQPTLGRHTASTCISLERRMVTARLGAGRQPNMLCTGMVSLDRRLGQWSVVFRHRPSHVCVYYSRLSVEATDLLPYYLLALDFHSRCLVDWNWTASADFVCTIGSLVLDTSRSQGSSSLDPLCVDLYLVRFDPP